MKQTLTSATGGSRCPSDNPIRQTSSADKQSTQIPFSTALIKPQGFVCLGAFRLADIGERPHPFAYGSAAMTFRPGGDPNGTEDGFPGSLFIMGHDRMTYGEMPGGNQVAGVPIPQPITTSNLSG
jgi:hypothetical protein